jgi:hypothetical protein
VDPKAIPFEIFNQMPISVGINMSERSIAWCGPSHSFITGSQIELGSFRENTASLGGILVGQNRYKTTETQKAKEKEFFQHQGFLKMNGSPVAALGKVRQCDLVFWHVAEKIQDTCFFS